METEEFKSEGEYLCDVDNVGAENTRQKIKAELDRSARLNRADKENKRRYRSKRGSDRSVILTFGRIKERTALHLCHHNRCHRTAS